MRAVVATEHCHSRVVAPLQSEIPAWLSGVMKGSLCLKIERVVCDVPAGLSIIPRLDRNEMKRLLSWESLSGSDAATVMEMLVTQVAEMVIERETIRNPEVRACKKRRQAGKSDYQCQLLLLNCAAFESTSYHIVDKEYLS